MNKSILIPFVLLTIDDKIISNFEKNGAHLTKKKKFEKNIVHFKGLSVLNMQKGCIKLHVSKFCK
jgi:hypothetical protein